MKSKFTFVVENIEFKFVELKLDKVTVSVEVEMDTPVAMSHIGLVQEQVAELSKMFSQHLN
jgi:hypothetical protein